MMINHNKNNSIYLLFLIYLLGTWTVVGNITAYELTSDYLIYENLGVEYFFLPLHLFILTLNVLTLFFLLRPKSIGFYTALLSFTISLATTLICYTFTVFNSVFVKEVYIQSRITRGLNKDIESVDFIFSTSGLILLAIFIAGWYCFIGWVIYKNKSFFVPKKTKSSC